MQRAALQALKMFFIEASHENPILKLSNKDPAQLEGSTAAAPAHSAHAVYHAWLQRQHNTYLDTLFSIISGEQHSASIQVAAASAVMEAVRSAGGAGVFVHDLLLRLVRTMATAPGVKPEVFTLLFTRYFQYADVRYYTLISIKYIASMQSSSRPASPAGGATAGKEESRQNNSGQHKQQGVQGAATGSNGSVPASTRAGAGAGANNSVDASTSEEGTLTGGDVFRNLFDMLAVMPDPPPSSSGSDAQGQGKPHTSLQQQDEEEQQLRSWCGLAETVGVAAAPDKNESSKMRRKRKAAEALALEKAAKRGPAAAAAAAAATQQKVTWANPLSQRRAYR
jgi:U3 small nucleolar RNA-associated protein 19